MIDDQEEIAHDDVVLGLSGWQPSPEIFRHKGSASDY